MKKSLLFLFSLLFISINSFPYDSGWKDLNKILKSIKPPEFADKSYLITDFGALADGKTDCTSAIRDAVEKCTRMGGGKVIVPEGTFLTGAIHLKSRVNLVISKGAVLKFSTDPTKYLPVVYTRFEGTECMNYSPLIYAYKQQNIAVTGEGILDGQGSKENWWKWKASSGEFSQKPARDKLVDMGEKNIPVKDRIFGEGSFLRPVFFQPYMCKNILVEGVTFKNSSMWFLNPVLCKNVTFNNVATDGIGPNNDGCDPESCLDVLIKGCSFNNGDDCIAIKSGRNNDGRRVNVPCKNIVIQNCIMKDGHGGVVIGSEVSGNISNVYAEDCVMNSPNLDRAFRFKTNSERGGIIKNVYARNIKVGEVGDAVILIDYYYEGGDIGKFTPVMRNFHFNNITSNKSPYALKMKAYERSHVKNLQLENCSFENVKNPNIIENIEITKCVSVTINDKPLEIKN
ncbi:MAG: glycoside hydrolase family 28 protein [Ignavibacteriaceae bacterium]|nr:glycoside hydrolase family 28 protein [Ignavibacteriaceae bacterium]